VVSVPERQGRGLPSLPAPSAPITGRGRRFVGIDRGLAAFAVVAGADGVEICRFTAPRPLTRRLGRLQQRSRALSRAQRGSRNRVEAARLLARAHHRIADIRRSFLHEISSQLAKTHSGLAVEDLPVGNLLRTSALPGPSPMPPGPSSRASFDTRRPGSGASWWSATAGFPPPRPALLVAGPYIRWRWGRGPFVAVSVGWSWTGTATPPPISPPGPRQQPVRSSRPRTAKQAAG
jgi:hypothetical protein